jgi:CheY-like chemotaxis protein
LGRRQTLFCAAKTVFWLSPVQPSGKKILGNLILIVDDDEVDQFMLERTLRSIGVRNPIRKLSDGRSALGYLEADPPYNDRALNPFPAAIFLDLKMSGVTGWDVLDWISGFSMKQDAKIFVHSDFNQVADLPRLYRLGADSFIPKPLQESDLFNLVYHFPAPFEVQRPS